MAKKRAFERREGEMVDRDAEGSTVVFEGPLFGGKARSHKKKASSGELSLLVEDNDLHAAHELIAQRARRSADALAKRAKTPVDAIILVLGRLGGTAARKTLEKQGAAAAILGLDAEAEDAAKLLVRSFHQGPIHRRERAVEAAARIHLGRQADTAAMDRLGAGLRGMLRADEHLFVRALPALCAFGDKESEIAIARARRILASKDKQLRADAFRSLIRVPLPFAYVPILREWLASEPSLRLRTEATHTLVGVLDEDWIASLVKRGLAQESPGLRVEALHLLERLERKMQRRLLRAAVRDEPDEDIRTEMKRRLR
jgi:hypothetical protein